MHETLPDNKINKISKVNEREEKGSAPTKKKDIPKDTSMIDLDIGNTSLDNSKEKKKEQGKLYYLPTELAEEKPKPKLYYLPTELVEKPQNEDEPQSENDGLLNDEDES